MNDERKLRLIVADLLNILDNLDEFDTPTRKLPNCPRCDEDELGVIHPDLVLCYRCNWKLEGKCRRGKP